MLASSRPSLPASISTETRESNLPPARPRPDAPPRETLVTLTCEAIGRGEGLQHLKPIGEQKLGRTSRVGRVGPTARGATSAKSGLASGSTIGSGEATCNPAGNPHKGKKELRTLSSVMICRLVQYKQAAGAATQCKLAKKVQNVD